MNNEFVFYLDKTSESFFIFDFYCSSDSVFKWYKNEEQMRENIKDLKEFIKEFTVNKAIEVLQARNIEI